MSLVTLSSLQRMQATQLADMMLAVQAAGLNSDTSKIAVVDVRDDDYIGGHIHGSINIPSRSLDAMMPTLLRKLEGKETVVFHCALSQQRGPSAALRYMREKEAADSASKTKNPDAEAQQQPQTVYILDRGFVGWQEKYGPDERLTEAYRKEIWEDY
ncbi:phosphoprotein phosphatase-like protein [Apiospora rasikravindrae]|uniref:Phosphoprotein phosphatase-like protein n=1 Tax=Apiospora rasikravindrae TaxID=990691 RepID=A0ABR1U0R2_9PEZI